MVVGLQGVGISVEALPAEVALALWDASLPLLARAVEEHPGEFPECLDGLRDSVGTGRRMLVHIYEGPALLAVALLEFERLRDGDCLYVRYLGGQRMDEWLHELHARLGEIARAYDCAWVGLTGRLGWRKALAGLGWEPVAIQMRVSAWPE